MELSRAGEKALAKADVAAMNAANDVYSSSFYSLKSTYQELLLQKDKAKKRVSAGGSVAGGDAAASSLVFEMADLLFLPGVPRTVEPVQGPSPGGGALGKGGPR
jgi:hypothetical protein